MSVHAYIAHLNRCMEFEYLHNFSAQVCDVIWEELYRLEVELQGHAGINQLGG